MITRAQRLTSYQSGFAHGWSIFDPFSLPPCNADELFVIFRSEPDGHELVIRRQTDGLFVKALSGALVGTGAGFDFIKPYDGNLRPLPGEPVYDNTKTVVVMLVPTRSGLLLTRRAEPATLGKLALPGGWQEKRKDMTWQLAGCREVFEETGLILDPKYVNLIGADTVEDGAINLLFGMYMKMAADPVAREPNNEVLEVLTTNQPVETAFETHTKRIATYFRAIRGTSLMALGA